MTPYQLGLKKKHKKNKTDLFVVSKQTMLQQRSFLCHPMKMSKCQNDDGKNHILSLSFTETIQQQRYLSHRQDKRIACSSCLLKWIVIYFIIISEILWPYTSNINHIHVSSYFPSLSSSWILFPRSSITVFAYPISIPRKKNLLIQTINEPSHKGIAIFRQSQGLYQSSSIKSTKTDKQNISTSTKSANNKNDNNNDNITSNIISSLAEIALKSRLTYHDEVKCIVSSSSKDLIINGIIGPVTVKGKNWSSPSGTLTCQAIEATVQTCQLDYKRIIQYQKLLLIQSSYGKAIIALNENDFCNFINHPLFKQSFESFLSNKKQQTNHIIKFLKEPCQIRSTTTDNNDNNGGQVTFMTLFQDIKWQCTLQRSSKNNDDDGDEITSSPTKTRKKSKRRAQITVIPQQPQQTESTSQMNSLVLETLLTDFFNEMIFELYGTFLSYRDMTIVNTNNQPFLLLALYLHVEKFPSPGINF